MTDEFMNKLNETLVTAYRSILKIEHEFIKRTGTPNVSTSEMHLLEAIGKTKGKGRTVKEIASDLCITQPSVSAAVNRLVQKGCIERRRSTEDGRVVYIHLTPLGHKTYSVFMRFHENMVRAVANDLGDEEKAHLLKGMVRLNTFFEKQFIDEITQIGQSSDLSTKE
ncbi:MAG: MarR family winged helix-turn-helix transcriptional regulator [Candidatus Fimivivens sp.]